jgi:threonine dehydrogenase-like Zn-dependent dehydrogenase
VRRAVLAGPRRFELEDAPLGRLEPKDVRVRVGVCGVCASELAQWKTGRHPAPANLGHEVSGEVVEIGPDVTAVRPGAVVTGLFKGGFAEFAATVEDRVVPVPAGVGLGESLGEPLACIVSAAARTRVELGDAVGIVGLGFMGLLMLEVLRMRGAGVITAIDVRADALDAARRLGAHETFAPDRVPDRLRVLERAAIAPGSGVDVAVEASGTQPGLTLAGEMVREHGQLSILGYHNEGGGRRDVDLRLWNWKALEVLNAHERRAAYKIECMRRGLALLAARRIEVGSLITHRFGLDQLNAAFAALEAKTAGFCKAVVEIPPRQ